MLKLTIRITPQMMAALREIADDADGDLNESDTASLMILRAILKKFGRMKSGIRYDLNAFRHQLARASAKNHDQR